MKESLKELLAVSFLTTLDSIEALQTVRENSIVKPPPEKWSKGNKDLVLINGWKESWTALKTIGNLANDVRLGYRIHTIPELGNNTHSPLVGTELVKLFIKKNRLNKFSIAAHSMGGIIAALLLGDPDLEPKIDRVITLATPFKGTFWGKIKPLKISELAPNSKTLKLVDSLGTAQREKIFNLFPYKDTFISRDSLKFENANNIEVAVVGHMDILKYWEALKIIEENLIYDRLTSIAKLG